MPNPLSERIFTMASSQQSGETVDISKQELKQEALRQMQALGRLLNRLSPEAFDRAHEIIDAIERNTTNAEQLRCLGLLEQATQFLQDIHGSRTERQTSALLEWMRRTMKLMTWRDIQDMLGKTNMRTGSPLVYQSLWQLGRALEAYNEYTHPDEYENQLEELSRRNISRGIAESQRAIKLSDNVTEPALQHELEEDELDLVKNPKRNITVITDREPMESDEVLEKRSREVYEKTLKEIAKDSI